MALIFNNTQIPANGTIKFNGTSLTKIICNGVTVWQKSASANNTSENKIEGGIDLYNTNTAESDVN